MIALQMNRARRMVTAWICGFVRAHRWLLLLLAIELSFFLVNFKYGKFYAFTDVTLVELHPVDEFLKRFSMWQEYRGFGVALGTEAGWALPLGFSTILSMLGLHAFQINFVNNLLLFVLPGIGVYSLTCSMLYDHSSKGTVSFLSGLLTTTSFCTYIVGIMPFFFRAWAFGMLPFILSDILMLMRTGRRRFWVILIALCYLNLPSVAGFPYLVAGLGFVGAYVVYYIVIESRTVRRDLTRILLASILFIGVSAPLIVAWWDLLFSQFQASSFARTYTSTVLSSNLLNLDFSDLFWGLRLIGTSSWNQTVWWTGRLFHPFSVLFTWNPLFVLCSFLLPITAFGSLLFKGPFRMRCRLAFLGTTSVILLFLMKGVRAPLGGIFLWLMRNVSLFSMFRTPYDKIAPALVYPLTIMSAFALSRIFGSLRKRSSVVRKGFAAVFLIALAVNCYPAYSGQILFPGGFVDVPTYYQQIADYVRSDPRFYKILGVPEIGYTNLYRWGYFGVAFDGVNLNKPVLHRSYAGNDVYDTGIINAIHNEVTFASELSSEFVPGISGQLRATSGVFPDNADPNANISIDRVRYFDYLLRKSNVGYILFREDMVGPVNYRLNELDWKRYRELFSSLLDLGLVRLERRIGNVTLYSVNDFKPLVYATSTSTAFATNDYDNFLESYFAESRFAVLGSLFGYDDRWEYLVGGGDNLGMAYVYVPLMTRQYEAQIAYELAMEKSSSEPDTERISTLAGTLEQLREPELLDPKAIYYVDDIRKPGLFDIFLRMDDALAGKVVGMRVFLGDEVKDICCMDRDANGWFRAGSVRLGAGRLLIKVNLATKGILTDGAGLVQGAGSDKMDILLLASNGRRAEAGLPTVTFERVYPGKVYVRVERARGPFFLNFLETFDTRWKLYLTDQHSAGSIVGEYDGSIELAHETSFADLYDLNALSTRPVLDDEHAVLDGFANSWYIDANELARQGITARNADGTYSFSVVLYFQPQALFVVSTMVSAAAGLLACVLVFVGAVDFGRRSKKRVRRDERVDRR